MLAKINKKIKYISPLPKASGSRPPANAEMYSFFIFYFFFCIEFNLTELNWIELNWIESNPIESKSIFKWISFSRHLPHLDERGVQSRRQDFRKNLEMACRTGPAALRAAPGPDGRPVSAPRSSKAITNCWACNPGGVLRRARTGRPPGPGAAFFERI